jgi:hypothetical protein
MIEAARRTPAEETSATAGSDELHVTTRPRRIRPDPLTGSAVKGNVVPLSIVAVGGESVRPITGPGAVGSVHELASGPRARISAAAVQRNRMTLSGGDSLLHGKFRAVSPLGDR